MASRNEQGQIGIPGMGVRKDVNELVSTSDMAIDASNVMVYDATIRPRPALSREGFGQSATSWQQIFIKKDNDPDGTRIELIGQINDGDLIIVLMRNEITSERFIRYSVNGGWTFVDDMISDPPPLSGLDFGAGTTIAVKFIQVGDNLYCFQQNDHYYQTGRIYVADVSDYPNVPIVFTEFLTYPDSDPLIIGANPQWIQYDPVTDSLIVQKEYPLGGFLNVPPVDPSIGRDGRPRETIENDNIFYYPNFSTISNKNDIQNVGGSSFSFKTYSYGGFRSRFMGFQGGLIWFKYDYEFWSNPNGRPEFGTNTLMRNRNVLHGFVPGQWISASRGAWTTLGVRTDVFSRDPRRIYPGSDNDHIFVLWTNGLQEIDLLATGVNWYDQKYYQLDPAVPPIGPSPDARLDVYHPGISPTDEARQMFTGMNETFTIVSKPDPEADVLEPWDDFTGDTSNERVSELIFNPTWGYGTFYLTTGPSIGWKEYNRFINVRSDAKMYIVPGSTAPPNFEDSADSGDVTSIFQADLDRDPNAVVVGTTTKILRLNRATDFWDEITSTGTSLYPLAPNTRLSGEWGLNPVIFRIFESGSNRGDSRTWLLATNGVDPPLVFNEDLPNGVMRFMGNIINQSPNDQIDPGYIETDSDPFGIAAPVARCMAVASNRVLLGNLPNVSGYAVDVSTFNDMDRGWGRVQRTLVGDTPGEIVSMNEISALQVAIYKTDAIYSAVAQVDFITTQAPFRFELVKAGVPGPCSPMSVLRMHTGEQAYLGRDGGVYVYDGVAPRDVGRNVRRMVQPYLDTNNYGQAWGMVDNSRKLLWFFFPTKSQNINRGIVMSTDQGLPFPVWPIQMPPGWQMTAGARCFFVTDTAIGELPESLISQDPKTLGDYQTGRDEMCIGRINNSWFTQKWNDDGDYTDDGIPIDVYLKTGWNPIGPIIQFKTVHELYHLFKAEGDELYVNMSVAAHQADTSSIISGPELLNRLSPQLRTNHRVTGTRFSLEMRSQIRRMFNWGGATATFKTRGMR